MYRIGIDIGGMSAKFGLVEKDRVLEERVLETGADISYGKFLDDASDVVAALCENWKVEAVGISSCGLINSGQGKIVYSNNIGWEDKRIAADLLERTALPVRCEMCCACRGCVRCRESLSARLHDNAWHRRGRRVCLRRQAARRALRRCGWNYGTYHSGARGKVMQLWKEGLS